jgi:hypothetical protein
MNPIFASEGECRNFHVSHRRPEIMGQNAARNRERQWRVDFSMRLGCAGKAVYSWKVADPRNTRSRATCCRPAIHRLSASQNVAGLWLLYGYGVGHGGETVENRNFPDPA